MFGGLYCPSSCGWYCRYLWAQQRAALLCKRDRSPLVRSVGKLLCSSVVQTLSSDWHMYDPLPCYPPTLLLGQMLPVFFMRLVREPLLCYAPPHYCWSRCCPFFIPLVRVPLLSYPPYTTVGADAVRFIYGWLRDPLLRYSPLHYCWGTCCPCFIRLVREALLSYPPLHYCRSRCCPFLIRSAA